MSKSIKPMIRNRRRGPNQEAVLAALDTEQGRKRLDLEEATGLARPKVVSALAGLLRRGDAIRARKASAGRTTSYTWFKSADAA